MTDQEVEAHCLRITELEGTGIEVAKDLRDGQFVIGWKWWSGFALAWLSVREWTWKLKRWVRRV